jgi:hypothetical protein
VRISSIAHKPPGAALDERGNSADLAASGESVVRISSIEKLCYLGVLGPRKRATQMLCDLGINSRMQENHFHAPMGLDIGADGADQVALAVVAEIQSTLNGRPGGSLRDRIGSIHGETGTPESVWVQSIVCA